MVSIDTAIILVGEKNLKDNNPLFIDDPQNKKRITHNITKLIEEGFQNIIISTNTNLEKYESYIDEMAWDKSLVRVTKEREPLGSGGAIKNVLLGLSIDEALVLYNDIEISNMNLKSILDTHIKSSETNSLISDPNSKILLKDQQVSVKNDIFILNIDIFNHTHLQKFSFITELLCLTYNDEFNYIN